MKIEIELSEEDAAYLVANHYGRIPIEDVIRDLALDKAAAYKRHFQGDTERAVTAFRESQAKKGAQA